MDRVYAYVSRWAGSRTVAEDVTSAVFEQALTHLPRFELRGVPFPPCAPHRRERACRSLEARWALVVRGAAGRAG